jgi:hypothetical protein
MTRKDYVRIAAAIKAARAEIVAKEPDELHSELLDGVSYTADFLADALKADNPSFDRARFLAACGIMED